MEDYLTPLVEQGYYLLSGVDEYGEPTYVPNLQKMQDEWPELYNAVMTDVYQELQSLEEMGLVKTQWDDELNDYVTSITM
jgi:DNA-binding PadR family transcriptional regulator